METLKQDITYTKYQFPKFGELVTMETLLQKLNAAEEVCEGEEGMEQLTFYGWWPRGVADKYNKLPKPAEEYIPEIGETLFLQTPSFWDFWMGGSMELLRITENTFVVIDVNEERYWEKKEKEIEEMKKPVKYWLSGYNSDNSKEMSTSFTVSGTASAHEIYQTARGVLTPEYRHYMIWNVMKED